MREKVRMGLNPLPSTGPLDVCLSEGLRRSIVFFGDFSFPFQFMVALQIGGDFLSFCPGGTSHEPGSVACCSGCAEVKAMLFS